MLSLVGGSTPAFHARPDAPPNTADGRAWMPEALLGSAKRKPFPFSEKRHGVVFGLPGSGERKTRTVRDMRNRFVFGRSRWSRSPKPASVFLKLVARDLHQDGEEQSRQPGDSNRRKVALVGLTASRPAPAGPPGLPEPRLGAPDPGTG